MEPSSDSPFGLLGVVEDGWMILWISTTSYSQPERARRGRGEIEGGMGAWNKFGCTCS